MYLSQIKLRLEVHSYALTSQYDEEIAVVLAAASAADRASAKAVWDGGLMNDLG